MYNALIVDDEVFAVEGIVRGIDWPSLGVENIYKAYDAEEAKELLKKEQVDFMISDIEMPGWDGLKLVEWVKRHCPSVEIIFLTGHANFSFAQQALQLGSFDYLLKPIDYSVLKGVIGKLLEQLKQEREQQHFNEVYRKYYQIWENQLPLLVERFWLNVIHGRIPATRTGMEYSLELYKIPLAYDHPVIPVMISVEQWGKELSASEEEIMGYALRKAASEIILEGLPGDVIQDIHGGLFVLLYGDKEIARLQEVRRICEAYIEACNKYFDCRLSCYIGEPVEPSQIRDSYFSLLEMERCNAVKRNQVLDIRDHTPTAGGGMSPVTASDWAVLFETGNKLELFKRMDTLFSSHTDTQWTTEMLEELYFSFLHIVYSVMHKRGVSVYQVYDTKDLQEYPAVIRSVSHLRAWLNNIIYTGMDYLHLHHNDHSVLIRAVHQYIADHIHEDITRENIAKHVYLNPAYLSKLYKKETGASLSDHILQTRMNLAAKMLSEGNHKVSVIAESLGYTHFSHFAKMFKKVFGIGPQEYRKQYQAY